MEAETNNEQAATGVANDAAREHVRKAVAALTESELTLTDVEIGNLMRDCPIAARLLASSSSPQVDVFMRSLPDDLFWRLYALARDFSEWSDPCDFDTWPGEFFYLVFLLARNERGRQAGDDELITSARALTDAVIIEALRRDGRFSFVEAYSLTSERPPRRIPAKLSETEH